MVSLERFRLLETSEVDEFRANMTSALAPARLEPIAARPPIHFDVSMVNLGPMQLIYGRSSGSELDLQLTEQISYYDVNFVEAGNSTLAVGKEEVGLDGRTAGIFSPRMLPRMRLSDGYDQLHIRFEQHALERHLEDLLGRDVPGPIRFRMDMDTAAGAAASWTQAVHLLVRDLEDPEGLAWTGEQSPWTRFLMSGLLLAQPHNYSEQLHDRRAVRRPAPLKRVVELIEANPAADHSLMNLAAVAGVAPRTLQQHFKDYVGASPRDFVQSVRLARAHEDLVNARPGTTVAEVAWRWGFTHLPRFASAYQKRYGVLPSTALRGA
jgi:AraC-like DNA-binding protein